MPALVMSGQRDRRARPAEVRRVYEALAGPKTLQWFEAGHESMRGADPRRWQVVVDAFMTNQVHAASFCLLPAG